MLDDQQLRAAAQRIAAEASGPAKVIVFGSYARGDADEASVRQTLRTELARVYPETAAAVLTGVRAGRADLERQDGGLHGSSPKRWRPERTACSDRRRSAIMTSGRSGPRRS